MKKVLGFITIVLLSAIALSCDKEKGEQETAETAKLSVVVNDAKAIYEVPQYQGVNVTLAVAADPVSEESYTITLAAKPDLVNSYNAANGTSYKAIPAEAYSLPSTSLMLIRYSTTSSTCDLRLKGEGCVEGETYLLPIVVGTVSGGTNYEAPDDKAAYIVFKMTAPEQEGSGTEADPYLIRDLNGFMKMDGLLKDDGSVYFKLMSDLDFSAVEFTEDNPWVPINSGEEEVIKLRKIYFDGNNHTISNFNGGGALFAYLVGSVENLTIDNANIECLDANLGGTLAGDVNGGVVKNVTVTNSKLISNYKRNGGLIGWLISGSVEDCNVDCFVDGMDSQAGGLIGRIDEGTVKNCSASGDVTCGTYYSGGLVGYVVSATITGSHATGNITHTAGNYGRTGGLVGEVSSSLTVEKCYATGNITSTGHFAGGLVGTINGEGGVLNISKSYATGNVTIPITGNFSHAGGLLGSVVNGSATINDCYSTGAITARRYSGGFIGTVSAKMALTVKNGYTVSDISALGVPDLSGEFIGRVNDGATVACSGFVAWDVNGTRFVYGAEVPVSGNYFGTEGTVSSQASKLGWDTTIWDLSKDLPTLK